MIDREKQTKLLNKFEEKITEFFKNMGADFDFFGRVEHCTFVIRYNIKFNYLEEGEYYLIAGFDVCGVGKAEYENFMIEKFLKEMQEIKTAVLEKYFTVMTNNIGFNTNVSLIEIRI